MSTTITRDATQDGMTAERGVGLAELAARMGLRISQRWEGTPEQQAEYAREHASRDMRADETDVQIASRVRMLMRDDLDHDAVVTTARDRICALTVERDTLLTVLQKALADSGCDGDLCAHQWHEDARAAIALATGDRS